MSNFGLSTNDQKLLHTSLMRRIDHLEVMGADLDKIRELKLIARQVEINRTRFTVPNKCDCGCITFWFYNDIKRCTNCQEVTPL